MQMVLIILNLIAKNNATINSVLTLCTIQLIVLQDCECHTYKNVAFNSRRCSLMTCKMTVFNLCCVIYVILLLINFACKSVFIYIYIKKIQIN